MIKTAILALALSFTAAPAFAGFEYCPTIFPTYEVIALEQFGFDLQYRFSSIRNGDVVEEFYSKSLNAYMTIKFVKNSNGSDAGVCLADAGLGLHVGRPDQPPPGLALQALPPTLNVFKLKQ